MNEELARRIGLIDLVEVGRRFDARGWVPATSGNFSVRDPEAPRGFWITASGRHKGRLGAGDFVRIDIGSGEPTERASEGARPSAETSLHAAVYRHVPDAQAVLHVHALAGTLLSRRAAPHASSDAGAPRRVALPNVEILKAFDRWEPEPNVGVEVFDNHPSVADIAAEVDARFARGPFEVPGFLIDSHGLTAWGPSLERAEYAVEAFEYAFRLTLEL